MVEGADECCDPMPIIGAAAVTVGAGAAVAREVLLTDGVPVPAAGETVARVGGAMASKGGYSIIFPAVGSMCFTICGVIICRF
jgi:hypothetical protein